jgi:hypothetical protein
MRRLPWFTLVAAAVLILNPLGWEIVGSAIRYSATDWLRDLWVMVTLIGLAVLALLGGLEACYRGRRARTAKTERELGTET